MKYSKQWQRDVHNLPEELQDACIDYRAWKKVAKQPATHTHAAMIQRLADDMRRVERVFVSSSASCSFRQRLMCCRTMFAGSLLKPTRDSSNTTSGHTNVMYAFAMLNKTCVCKAIKRCDKRTGSRLREWYNAHKHEFSFCGGVRLTRFALESGQQQLDDCPVCLEPPTTGVILECGHIVCLECIKDMYQIRYMRGTISNLVRTSIYMNRRAPCCPLCRCQTPLRRVSSSQLVNRRGSGVEHILDFRL